MSMEKIFTRLYAGVTIFIIIVVAFCLMCARKTDKQKENMDNNISSVLPQKDAQNILKTETSNRQLLLCENFENMYTYDNLIQDLNTISNQYSDYIQIKSLCDTYDGRKVIDIVISGSNAKKSIFINGGTHANEYISCQLVMKQLVSFLDTLKNNDKYNNVLIKDLIKDVTIHVVPMINPDGITLCQKGLDGIQNKNVADTIKQIAQNDGESISSEYFHTWKANAQGIDINRNYPSNWTTYNECSQPSSSFYKGPSIASTNEAKAIMDLTLQQKFVRAISYHTQGQLIYCVKNNNFVKLLSNLTGYDIKVQGSNVEPAYSDWTDRDLSMKSVTIELGSGKNPLPQTQLKYMWEKNKYVWFATLLDLQKNGV